MEALTLKEIAKALNTKTDFDVQINAVCIDTRKITKGCLFICIKGERFDAHQFANEALSLGAAAVMISEDIEVNGAFVKVENTSKALLDLSAYYRSKFNIPVVALTGSVGKTTTKEFTYLVVNSEFNAIKTQGNLNNEIGLPQMLFQIDNSTEAAVIEMGMNHFGEIHRLVTATKPTLAMITNIGVSHIENLGSREGIFKAKMEMTKLFTKDNTLIVNGDDDYLSKTKGMGEYKVVYYGITNPENDVYAKDIENNGLNGIKFTAVVDGGEYPIEVNVPGKHNVYNALAAICVGREFDVPMDKIAEGIRSFELTKMRLAVEEYNGITIINDCYNASPDSIKAALGVLADTDKNRKVAILGDVLEMGDFAKDAHYNLGKVVKESGVDLLITAGENMKYLAQGAKDNGVENIVSFDKTLEVCNYVKAEIKSGDAVLIKASRGMHFEEVYNTIKNK